MPKLDLISWNLENGFGNSYWQQEQEISRFRSYGGRLNEFDKENCLINVVEADINGIKL